MNKTILAGRLTKDIDIRYSDNADKTAVARTGIAVNRYGKKDEADFINLVAFGKTAEFMEKWFSKGDPILIEGHIQTGSYKNKEGNTVYTTDVIVTTVEFNGTVKKQNKTEEVQQEQEATSADGFMQIDDLPDEGLPFN